MVRTTKKLGPAGRFGARYGSLARKQVATVERVQRKKHVCLKCGAHAVSRLHTGIWQCRKCDHQFAGGAYVPQTGAGRGARKALRGIGDRLIRGQAMEEEISFHALVEEEEAADELAEYESYEEELEALERGEPVEEEPGAAAVPDDDASADAEPTDDPETADEPQAADEPEDADTSETGARTTEDTEDEDEA